MANRTVSLQMRSPMTIRISTGPKSVRNDAVRPGPVPHNWHWWRWFAIGFLAVFIGMSLTVTMFSWTPAGDGLMRCKLWQYYGIEARRAFSFSRNALGPTSGSFSAALTTFSEHFLCSAAGGAATGRNW